MKIKNGFTLIELLAVIVILAVIALIATPAVLNIINNSKNKTTLRSAELYVGTVENSLGNIMLDEVDIEDGTYSIMKNGNLCLELNNNTCTKGLLKMEINGKAPNGGTITLKDGKIEEVELEYKDKIVAKNSEGKLEYLDSSNSSTLLYKIGQEVTFNPGDQDRTWNVIDEDDDAVTLMLNQNLIYETEWVTSNDYSDNISWENDRTGKGPISALKTLNKLTETWKNVDPIEKYNYVNNESIEEHQYGYQKLNIINGEAELINKYGTVNTKIEGISRARIASLEEIVEISIKANPNLNEENLINIFETNIEDIIATFGFEVEPNIDSLLSRYYSKYTKRTALIYLAFMTHNEPMAFASDIGMPEWLSNIEDSWLLTSVNDYHWYAYYLSSGSFSGYAVVKVDGVGLRPVITIPKSKLSK